MSREDSTFLCPTCDQRFHGKLWAYLHIKETFGIEIAGEQLVPNSEGKMVKLADYLEKKFLLEVNIV